MAQARQCPECGGPLSDDSAHGVCPKCFLQLGFHPPGRHVRDVETEAGSHFVPPKPSQLAPYLPSLEILDLIGQGGMGAVYKARQKGLDRLVALKILPPATADDPAFAERFSREARALARLNHPNIVGVHDSGEAGGLYYFVMEYVDGVNLREALQTGELTPKEALTIVPQICEALQYAHDEGVVHRDIKPENVLLDRKGRVKIADFGLARLLGIGNNDFTLTATNQVLGTPRYMSPEQMEGVREIDHRADIYSLGVVFYEMLTGELPLGRFEPPSHKAQLDARLDNIVLRTLEKEPNRRYQQASEIKSDVESILGPEHLHPQVRAMYGHEYRSKATLFGWPLLHIATGIDPKTQRRRVAKGVIAIGNVAVGALAIGGLGAGGIVIAGCGVGLFTLAGCSLGLLVAVGGAAIGIGLSAGGLAVGTVAVGGCAIGLLAIGGAAIGLQEIGPGMSRDAASRVSSPFSWALILVLSAALLAFTLIFTVGAAALLFSRRSANTNKSHRDHRPTAAGILTIVLLALLLPCIVGGTVIVGALVSYRAAGQRSRVVASNFRDVWWLDEKGPTLSDRGANLLELDPSRRQQVDEVLQEIYGEYRALEQENLEFENRQGRQMTTIELDSAQIAAIEAKLWTNLDALLDARHQSKARSILRVYAGTASGNQSDFVEPSLLGWGAGPVTIEISKVGSWYHWTLEVHDHQFRSQGPSLPDFGQRFWRDGDQASGP